MTDQEFLDAFERCTLPKEQWTHSAHIRMAWLYLREQPYEIAITKIREGIQKYNASMGNSIGYHETVTCLYARLVRDRMRTIGATSWEVFAQGCDDLFDRKSPPSLKYYRKETLELPEARARFIEPDLQPLP